MQQLMMLGLALILLGVASTVHGLPSAHTIQGVPYHRQETEYSCGDASFRRNLFFQSVYFVHQVTLFCRNGDGVLWS